MLISLNCLIKSTQWLYFAQLLPFAANISHKQFKKKVFREENVYDFLPKSNARLMRAYGFGFASTGALGIKKFLIPQDKNVRFVERSVVSYPVLVNTFPDENVQLKDIACGFGFTLFLCKKHKKQIVYGCGLNTDGQLGQHTQSLKATLVTGQPIEVIPEPREIQISLDNADITISPVQIACGRAHALIGCKSSNRSEQSPDALAQHATPGSSAQQYADTLFSLGNNAYGQAAREIIPDELFSPSSAVLTKVLLPYSGFKIKQIICGQDHSLVLSDDGKVYSCGNGTDGQTGLGNYDSTDRLTLVEGDLAGLKVIQLSSRGDTVLALTACGGVFAWGNNEYGQIWPVEDSMQVATPCRLPLDTPDAVAVSADCLLPGRRAGDFRLGRVQQVAAAGSMCALVDEFGQVWVWGFGHIGLGPGVEFASRPSLLPPNLFMPALPIYPDSGPRPSDSGPVHSIVSVHPGLHHFVARSSLGLLWAWGAPRGAAGCACLGLGLQPTQAARRGSVNSGVSEAEIGHSSNRTQTYPAQLSLPVEAVDVACGVDHTFVLSKTFV